MLIFVLSEAAACGTPTIVTSFLPGQEAGNVDLVVEGGWGAFVSEAEPADVKRKVRDWIARDDAFFDEMSERAKKDGNAKATLKLAEEIGAFINLKPEREE